ncbi:MAG: type II toxin-antitoxin system Phd/YefM family antitoxin [Opitutaceae bacterium]
MGLFDAKNRFSELCDTVARTSEPVLVTRRGKPLVRVVPATDAKDVGRSSVWDSVKEGRAKYGPIQDDLELPDREICDNRPSPIG